MLSTTPTVLGAPPAPLSEQRPRRDCRETHDNTPVDGDVGDVEAADEVVKLVLLKEEVPLLLLQEWGGGGGG